MLPGVLAPAGLTSEISESCHFAAVRLLQFFSRSLAYTLMWCRERQDLDLGTGSALRDMIWT